MAARFEEGLEGDYFETRSALEAAETLERIMTQAHGQLLFLLGDPGSGKTFLLQHLRKTYGDDREVIHFETPFMEPLAFLQRLLPGQTDTSIEVLSARAIEAYGRRPNLIMIDEAQLLSSQMVEFLRILADSKKFWILLAMHKKEGEAILSEPHFRSRPHRMIMLGELSRPEVLRYLDREMDAGAVPEDVKKRLKRLIWRIYALGSGNFRHTKRLMHALFELLDLAHKEHADKFMKPSSCLLFMAAIKAELVDA